MVDVYDPASTPGIAMDINRRMLLSAGAAFAGISSSELVGAEGAALTPSQNIGPFYPIVRADESRADLTRIPGQDRPAMGPMVHVTCKVIDPSRRPVRGAVVLVWQANAAGRYAHPRDTSAASLDPNFLGHVLMRTDREGVIRFLTVKPGAYVDTPGRMRTPHIHFEFIGEESRLITQMYFPDEPLNAADRLLQELSSRQGDVSRLMATRTASASAAMGFEWTVMLASS